MILIVRARARTVISHSKGVGALQAWAERAGVLMSWDADTFKTSREGAIRSSAKAHSNTQKRRVRAAQAFAVEGAVDERPRQCQWVVGGTVPDLHRKMDEMEGQIKRVGHEVSGLRHEVSGLMRQTGTTIALLQRMGGMMETLFAREGLTVPSSIPDDVEVLKAGEDVAEDAGPNPMALEADNETGHVGGDETVDDDEEGAEGMCSDADELEEQALVVHIAPVEVRDGDKSGGGV